MSIELAKKLRANPTAPERRLWRLLQPFRTNGYHFRKQVQIGSYYVDFACLHAALIIELDGETHGGNLAQSNDALRDDYLRGRGFHVLRLTNKDVMHNSEGTFTVIANTLVTRPTNQRVVPPSPTLPARGRVPAGERSETVPHPPADAVALAGRVEEEAAEPVEVAPNPPANTLPLAGRVGEGGAAHSNARRGSPQMLSGQQTCKREAPQ